MIISLLHTRCVFFYSTKRPQFYFIFYENYIFRKKPYYDRVTIQFRQMMHLVIVYY